MAWPKGVPRKRNIDKETAVNPFQSQESSFLPPDVQAQPQPDGSDTTGQGPEAPPHFVENSPGFKPFNDRSSLEDKYAAFIGLENQGEQKLETAEDKTAVPPPAEADTGAEPKTSETIEVKKDEVVTEPVVATPTPEPQPVSVTPEPPQPGEQKPKYKTIEEAEKAAQEAARKMHEATQERAKIEAEKRNLETFNKQMLDVLTAIKTSQAQPQAVPKQEEIQLTPEQKTELIINNPDEFERIVTENAERRILAKIEQKQAADQQEIQAASRQRGLELFVRMGEQHFNTAHQDMKIFEPYVKEESEKYITQHPDEAKELIRLKGPQGLIDKAVENTKVRIEQIRASLQAGTTPPAQAPVDSGVVRTPIPASPVVKPAGVIPAPVVTERPVPTGAEIAKDYVKERNDWKALRGLG